MNFIRGEVPFFVERWNPVKDETSCTVVSDKNNTEESTFPRVQQVGRAVSLQLA
jgi:hypothetical protein